MRFTRFITIICTAVLMLGLSAPVTPVSYEGKGPRKAGEHYFISNEEELRAFANLVNNGSGESYDAVLVADITLTSNWTPIGTPGNPFRGSFDGAGHTITRLSISGSANYCGLFGSAAGDIENLNLTGGSVSGSSYVGGIVGKTTGKLYNCSYSGSVSGSSYVGGIAGECAGEIKNCYRSGSSSNNDAKFIGGIVGLASGNIIDCTNYASVTGASYVGGIAGKTTGSLISNCLNASGTSISTSKTDGSFTYVGGIAGSAGSNIENCTNAGIITGQGMTGGIAGESKPGHSVTNCINRNNVRSSGDSRFTGGIVGLLGSYQNGTVSGNALSNCSNAGTITGGFMNTAGIVGLAGEQATITNCYNSGPVSATGIYAAGIVGTLLKGAELTFCTNVAEISGSTHQGALPDFNLMMSNDVYSATGGIVAVCYYSKDLPNCINSGNITGGETAGGIVGLAYYGGSPEHCQNSGNITVNQTVNSFYYAGAGGMSGFTNVWATYSINTGNVTVNGVAPAGGIAGVCLGGAEALRDNRNQGAVKGSPAGGIVGYSSVNTIYRCYNTGSVGSTDSNRVGGICGHSIHCTVSDCINIAPVTGQSYVGGIVGFADFKSGTIDFKIYRCSNSGAVECGNVDGSSWAGGIVGCSNSTTIEECANTAKVNASGAMIGGIVGSLSSATVLNSYNLGVVYGPTDVSGLMGRANGAKATNCYVKAPAQNGSVAGKYGVDTIEDNSYGTGRRVGALVGTGKLPEFSHVYWWTKCADRAVGWKYTSTIFNYNDGDDYGYFQLESRFNDSSNFVDWDFTNVWIIDSAARVPKLRFEYTLSINPTGGVGGTGGTGGSGANENQAPSNEYILTLDNLKSFRDSVNGGKNYSGVTVYLSEDIDLQNETWTPIGTMAFLGTFEGQGHTLRNLVVNYGGKGGLFSVIGAGGIVRDLCVYGTVTATGNAGGIAGESAGKIERCAFFGDVTSTASGKTSSCGGIVGSIGTNQYYFNGVYDCLHVGNVRGGGYAGGLIGQIEMGKFLERSIHIGGENSVTSANNTAGGIFGQAKQASGVSNCYCSQNSAPNNALYGEEPNLSQTHSIYSLSDEALRNLGSFNGFDIGRDVGHVWGMGWEHPLLQQFSDYVILASNGANENSMIVWMETDDLELRYVPFTRDGHFFRFWTTEEDGSGTTYFDRDAVPARITLYAQWTPGVPYHNYVSRLLQDGPKKIFDEDESTAWEETNNVANPTWTVEFATKQYVRPSGYVLTLADDSATASSRNPRSWKLEGKTGAGEWVLLDEVSNADLPGYNSLGVPYTIENTMEFCDFRLTISGVKSGKTLKLAEFYLLTLDPSKDVRSLRFTFCGNGAEQEDYIRTFENRTNTLVINNTSIFTRPGFSFTGWNSQPDGTGTSYTPGKYVMGYGDMVAYAQWKANPFTITFTDQDGTFTDTQTVYAGNTPTTSVTPTKEATKDVRYEFAGWDPEPYPVSQDQVYYAVFNEIPRTYGDPEFVWAGNDADGYSDPVAWFRTNDGEKEFTETIPGTSVSVSTVNATCIEPGKIEYRTTVIFHEQEYVGTKTVTIPALDHAWGELTYTWSGDNGTVTARHVCTRDSSHVETETVETTSEVVKDPTCTEMGDTKYTAVFVNSAFETQEKTVTDIAPLDHDWNEPTYEWTDDQGRVTAKRVCSRDGSHVETETVETTSEVVKDPTCTEKGDTKYTAVFVNAAFEKQEKTLTDIDPLDHKWGEPTYEWAEDDGSVTAKRVCERDGSHIETETVVTTSEVVKDPTCTEMGDTKYTAVFENAVFEKQEKTLTNIDPLEHEWGEPTYEWAEDDGSVTAKRVCAHDPSHVETETVRTTFTEKKATCTEKGEKKFTAVFTENAAFETQEKSYELPAFGHDFGEWSQTKAPTENEPGEEIRTCRNGCGHIELRIIPALGHKHQVRLVPAKAPTQTEDGNIAYYVCDGCGKWFEDEAATIEITDKSSVVLPATGIPETVETETEPEPEPETKPAPEPEPEEPHNLLWLWITLGAAALVAGGLLIFFIARKKKSEEE